MNPDLVEFRRGVIAPVECLKEGWALIKDQYWLFFGITIVGMLIGMVIPIILLGPMMVGINLCLLRRQRNEPVEFGDLFKGFDLFVPGLVVAVLKMIPMFLIMVPYYIILVALMATTMPHNGNPSMDQQRQFMFSFFGFEIVFFLTIMVVSFLIEIIFIFAFPLVADRGMSGLDATKLSFRASKANLGGVLGLLLLNGLCAFVGVLCCYVGVYFFLPIGVAAHIVAYRRVFPETASPFPSPPPPPGDWA
jgi:tetrahydromethanopterin S-methyltransferase subunit F